MISEGRLQHMTGVARKARELATKLHPHGQNFAGDMFLLWFPVAAHFRDL